MPCPPAPAAAAVPAGVYAKQYLQGLGIWTDHAGGSIGAAQQSVQDAGTIGFLVFAQSKGAKSRVKRVPHGQRRIVKGQPAGRILREIFLK